MKFGEKLRNMGTNAPTPDHLKAQIEKQRDRGGDFMRPTWGFITDLKPMFFDLEACGYELAKEYAQKNSVQTKCGLIISVNGYVNVVSRPQMYNVGDLVILNETDRPTEHLVAVVIARNHSAGHYEAVYLAERTHKGCDVVFPLTGRETLVTEFGVNPQVHIDDENEEAFLIVHGWAKKGVTRAEYTSGQPREWQGQGEPVVATYRMANLMRENGSPFVKIAIGGSDGS